MSSRSISKSVNIKDVAKQAKVSISTVSNVLNGTKPVSPALQIRVLDAVSMLGYETNLIARGLKHGRTNNIAVIVPFINSVFFPALLNSIQKAAEEKNYTISIFGTHSSLSQEKKYIQMVKSQWVDGILLSSSLDTNSPDAEEYLHSLATLSTNGHPVPVVCLEAAISDKLDAVIFNDKSGIQNATEYLIKIGRKTIGYIAAPLQFSMGKLRQEGYLSALKAHNYPIKEHLITEGDYTPLSGYHGTQKLLQFNPSIDAIVAGNDQMAIGAMRAVLDIGKRIPEDIAIFGFNGNFPASLTSPSLSTIQVPKDEMGTMAFNLLMRRLENPTASRMLITLEGKTVIRQSTDSSAKPSWDMDW